MSDTPEELMRAVSRNLVKIAKDINAVIADVAKEPTDWFLIVHTTPRSCYIGTKQGTKDAAETLQHLLDRWDGTIFPLPKQRTPRMVRLHSQLRFIATVVRDEIRYVAKETVPFSLVIHDPPNPPIYVSTAERDNVIKVLPDAIAMLKTGEHVPAHEVT